MDSNKDHIKDIFSSKLSNFEPDIPAFAWEKLDADLSKKSVNKNIPIRKRIYQISTAIAATAAILLLVFILMPSSQDEDFNEKGVLSNNYSRAEKDTTTFALEEKLAQDHQPVLRNTMSWSVLKHDKRKSLPNLDIEDINVYIEPILSAKVTIDPQVKRLSTSTFEKNESILVAEVVEPKEDSVDDVQDKSFEQDLGRRIAEFESKGNELNDMLSSTDGLIKSTPQGFQLGLEGGSGFSKSNDTKNQINAMQQGSNIVLRSGKVKLKHNQPITFGIGITKRINDRLSLETGINYAYISSKIRNEDDHVVKQKDAQYFHYFGIPLTLNYTFSEWQRFRFYASFGGMIQKDLYGRIRSNLYSGLINVDETDKKKISQKNPQFSTTATLGISYPIYDKLRIYTNFGGSYYIDAKNEYETIYSDKKWLFNLNLGVKFEF